MPGYHTVHWRQHVALDVGTATTRVAVGTASIIEKPSRAGVRAALANGVVVDRDAAREMLMPLLDRARVFGIVKPCILVCAPSDARPEERQLLADVIMEAGAASLAMIPEPLAAAIGSGVDVASPYAHMVIDIGEGVTDCAVIKAGKIQATCAIRRGCSHIRRSILTTGEGRGAYDDKWAETLLRTCGLRPPSSGTCVPPASAAMQQVTDEIADTIDSFIRDLPDKLGCDVIDSGICITGGGALVPGMREHLEDRLRISIRTAANPLASVAEGARAVLPVVLFLNQWH